MQSETLSLKANFKVILFKVGSYFTTALWIVIVWLVIVDVLEMSVTEWSYFYNSMPGDWKIWIFLGLLFIATIIFTLYQRTQKNFSLLFFILSNLIFIGTLIGHHRYIQYYHWLQEFPKLKSISTTNTIQGEKVEILGKNFGTREAINSVKVDNLEFTIVYWDDEKIIIEQPVPSRYFTDEMVLTNSHGNKLVIQNFMIRDPLEIWQ